ncbi:leucine--tRNA ligase [Candidatus Pacearchaeota archaeon]|nr:leucine--tRNA ligase [Candidatus Pacearchaeota archaeon]
MKLINFKAIEKKWQGKWEKSGAFKAKDGKGKKFYVLEQYPYPSGSGLHMGHAFIYTIGDIYARFKRMQGYNVMHPIGFDSFGLPAENAAIKAKSHPKKFTEDAIKNFIKQMKCFGFSYDWDRMLRSHDPAYYKWDQWIFLKMLEKGLAYRKKAGVNFCPKCNTVLANEQVVNGRCWRHEDTDVEVKQLEQWFLKTTEYADELLSGLDKLDDWPELIKAMQRNWIGKSEGTEVDFSVNDKKWKVFTTRVDTLFGVTFLVVSAQHPELMSLVTADRKAEFEKFLRKVKSTKEEDMDKMDKEGVFTGSYAKHPLTGKKIPIWTGNFVVADYGSGLVMGVPAHDARDWDFAKKYNLKIKQVIEGDASKEAYVNYGKLVNSDGFSGLNSVEAKEHITIALQEKGLGRKKIAYKLRDWLISRQRFWGTPIPIIYCDSCGAVPVREKDLPVKLPENIRFNSVENPLIGNKKFVNAKCWKCGGKARRETDTMDTFVDSSWYFLRYLDNKNKKKIFEKKKADYWMPVDLYIGGKEHATMHDIYFRFYTKFLADLGLLDVREPAKRLFPQGFIYGEDGRKMSKSLGNIIVPEKAAEKYGVDGVRLFLVSVAGPDKDFSWSEEGAQGSLRFILRLFEYFRNLKTGRSSRKVEHYMNKAIKTIAHDIECMKYNLAVIKLRELFGVIEKEEVGKSDLESFVKVLCVFCPHIAEEFWAKMKGKGLVSLASWPRVNEKKIDDKIEEGDKALDKIINDIAHIVKLVESKGGKAENVYLYVLPHELKNYNNKVLSERTGLDVKVYAVNDKDKYDPSGKSDKVKPGRPGIYVE